jgi:hypothetical protein
MDMKAQNWSSTALNPVGLIIRQKDRTISKCFRSTRRVHHTFGTVLHPQSFPHTGARSGRVSIVDTGRRAERAQLELRRSPRQAFKEEEVLRHTGVRR